MRPLSKFALIIFLLLLILLPAGLIYIFASERRRQVFVQWIFRQLADIAGLRLSTRGHLSTHRPLMLVANHSSYVDIFVLGALAPVSFTPKSDIRWWPIVGLCCILSGCVFVERKANKLPVTRERIHEGLEKGRVICLFPEGTTGDGTHMKPFKSGFFSLAEQEADLQIQPATIRYLKRDGQPLDEAGRAQIAWYGESTTLLPHLMEFLSSNQIEAELVFHEPVNFSQFSTRKELALYCEEKVKEGLGIGHQASGIRNSI